MEAGIPSAACIVLRKKKGSLPTAGFEASTNDQRFSNEALTLLGKTIKKKDKSSEHKHPRMRGFKCFLEQRKTRRASNHKNKQRS